MIENQNIPDPASKRTLAAIVFSDIAGFSALMQSDEDRTLKLVHRDLDLFKGICDGAGGRVLKTTGDGLLMYFDSAVQAVACALKCQQAVADAAKSRPAEQVLHHRIGIHLGDVFLTETDVMGDGVNVAARLQAEAEPDGVCISQTVYDVVKNRLAVKATYLGPRELKNIQEAVPVYQILLAAQGADGAPAKPVLKKKTPSHAMGVPLLAMAAAVVVLAGAVVWLVVWGPLSNRGGNVPSGTQPSPIFVTLGSQPAGQGASTQPIVVVVQPTSSQTPKGPTQAQIDSVRKSALASYKFSEMVAWLEKNEMKSSELYGRYTTLQAGLKNVRVKLMMLTQNEPLAIDVAGVGSCKLQMGDGGKYKLTSPDGSVRTLAFEQFEPRLMAAAAAVLPGQSQWASIFRGECVACGLMQN